MIASLYRSFERTLPPEILKDLETAIEKGLGHQDKVRVFFRADDIGVPSKNFSRMMHLFLKYKAPLCLALVPAWITPQRWEAMQKFQNEGGSLFCWHVHGYCHRNYETQGKKQEFGPARSPRNLTRDLSRGYDRLKRIVRKDLTPVFTPPWNRCSLEAMAILKQIGYQAVSRSHGSRPPAPEGLMEFPVHVDLHTRKETDPETGWQNLFAEFQQGMETGVCGIMLHHMRMNQAAFVFLEAVVRHLSENHRIEIVTYNNLI